MGGDSEDSSHSTGPRLVPGPHVFAPFSWVKIFFHFFSLLVRNCTLTLFPAFVPVPSTFSTVHLDEQSQVTNSALLQNANILGSFCLCVTVAQCFGVHLGVVVAQVKLF